MADADWRFVENKGAGLGNTLAVLKADGLGQYTLVFDEQLMCGAEQISLAVDPVKNRLGVFPSKGAAYEQPLVRLRGLVCIPCSVSALQAGVLPGTYAVEHGQSGELFFISNSGRRGDPLPIPAVQEEKQMTLQSTPVQTLSERLLACRNFVQRIGRPVTLKDRHNGYQLSVPGGKIFGFIRYNIKGAMSGKFVVYTFWPEADSRNIFEPQPENPNDIHLFFSPDDHDNVDYVLAVLRCAYDLAGPKRV